MALVEPGETTCHNRKPPFPHDWNPICTTLFLHDSLAERQSRMRPSRRILITMSSKRSIQSYPRPIKPLDIPSPFCPPVPFLSLQPFPPGPVPPLPSRPSIVAPEGWKRSEHALQAAHPRSFLETYGTLRREDEPHTRGVIPKDESKEARGERAVGEMKSLTTARYYATRVKEGEKVDRPGLWIAAEKWQREGGTGDGLVLVCTHANGFHKEVCGILSRVSAKI